MRRCRSKSSLDFDSCASCTGRLDCFCVNRIQDAMATHALSTGMEGTDAWKHPALQPTPARETRGRTDSDRIRSTLHARVCIACVSRVSVGAEFGNFGASRVRPMDDEQRSVAGGRPYYVHVVLVFAVLLFLLHGFRVCWHRLFFH